MLDLQLFQQFGRGSGVRASAQESLRRRQDLVRAERRRRLREEARPYIVRLVEPSAKGHRKMRRVLMISLRTQEHRLRREGMLLQRGKKRSRDGRSLSIDDIILAVENYCVSPRFRRKPA